MIKTKLIYNPRAGSKRHFFGGANPLLLQDIYSLFYKYEIEFDAIPTTKPGDARRLAREAAAAGCDQVIVAGGDGTVGEVANGLVGSATALGILPLGTFMNVARMLSIPTNLENAVMIIKMGNIRTIDLGEIIYFQKEKVDGKTNQEINYFLESVGIGLEADLQKFGLTYKEHRWQSLKQLLASIQLFYNKPLIIELDQNRTIKSKAQLVMISNGPYMGAGLSVAPSAKLNDHVLTVTLYKMSKPEMFWHLIKLKIKSRTLDSKHATGPAARDPAIQTFSSTFVKVSSEKTRPVDADARVFGETPIAVTIKPQALKVITGFTGYKKESALVEKKTYLNA